MKISKRHKVFNLLNFMLMVLIAFATLYPFYYIIIYSVSDPTMAGLGIYFLPKGFTLANYKTVFQIEGIGHAAYISVMRTLIGMTSTVMCSSMFAYGLSRKELPFRKFMYRLTVFSMYVGAGMIPTYLLFTTLHLKNTFWVYIIPCLVARYEVILIKTYMESLPNELAEAAQVEGAGFFQIYSKIMLPLSKPILATTAIFTSVGQWNSWGDNLFYNTKESLTTLQLMLYRLIQSQQITASTIDANLVNQIKVTPMSIQMTVTVVVVAPILLVYPYFQKHFIGGIMVGAIKG